MSDTQDYDCTHCCHISFGLAGTDKWPCQIVIVGHSLQSHRYSQNVELTVVVQSQRTLNHYVWMQQAEYCYH